ncbi:tryptophanyl-tRNA synthetase [Azotobacter vinelandii CA]|uniref:Tryptophan--tRNA ligase n=2 Tax=Azotobacter vinelandii TaxID=354 RepID=C1DQ75_AZOVD|nr:tryptophan--tRNA ligase [Azotobacter vinelandii]ACO77527.1 tryptophanyl-tRNA synthetase [Azotobacter vinelandii DJ]AGK12521.1 tryptophanyl-tRNA synthetase [Azotobacter vinelandii CA]AGK18910.1 tryptophanyl-tRNA synthetase [Azotobacter vinelandii CA6]SFX48156.1 tryptophanyl-tRNA synthetase [Azotobacter vinelandii]GLK60915.1 tryptophan--tRNA ligase [Azotobacter vinelandii]
MTTRILTGITTTGTPHLGNYAGAIRPAIVASRDPQADSFYFLADYHALIKCDDPARIQRSRLEIAATWLACGLDAQRTTFYRQSDIPEITELTWLLTCVTAKGLLNRAHAYKAAVDKNLEGGEDPDTGVTMGLFSYPVLMAADILMFNANKVPVGRDQIQHVEMARDIGQRFNHLFGRGRELFTLPEAVIEAEVATLPGLDGRKMSKSYDNTIPLFGSSRQLKDAIARIVTDSREPGEPKDPDGSHLFTLYQAFATPEQLDEFRADLLAGLAWGEAKQRLLQLLENELGEARERYQTLIARPFDLEDILLAGAAKARRIATPFLGELREAVGLRSFRTEAHSQTAGGKKKAVKTARFVSFREPDGSFRFRFLAADGEELLLSRPFDDPKAVGRISQQLIALGADALELRADEGAQFSLWLDGECMADSPTYADPDALEAAMLRLREAISGLAD